MLKRPRSSIPSPHSIAFNIIKAKRGVDAQSCELPLLCCDGHLPLTMPSAWSEDAQSRELPLLCCDGHLPLTMPNAQDDDAQL